MFLLFSFHVIVFNNQYQAVTFFLIVNLYFKITQSPEGISVKQEENCCQMDEQLSLSFLLKEVEFF